MALPLGPWQNTSMRVFQISTNFLLSHIIVRGWHHILRLYNFQMTVTAAKCPLQFTKDLKSPPGSDWDLCRCGVRADAALGSSDLCLTVTIIVLLIGVDLWNKALSVLQPACRGNKRDLVGETAQGLKSNCSFSFGFLMVLNLQDWFECELQRTAVKVKNFFFMFDQTSLPHDSEALTNSPASQWKKIKEEMWASSAQSHWLICMPGIKWIWQPVVDQRQENLVETIFVGTATEINNLIWCHWTSWVHQTTDRVKLANYPGAADKKQELLLALRFKWH